MANNETAPTKEAAIPAAPAVKSKMKKFLVAFKTPKRSFKIEAQDDKQAELWAREQLKVWKTNSKYLITPLDHKPAPAPKEPAKEAPKS